MFFLISYSILFYAILRYDFGRDLFVGGEGAGRDYTRWRLYRIRSGSVGRKRARCADRRSSSEGKIVGIMLRESIPQKNPKKIINHTSCRPFSNKTLLSTP